MTLANYLQVLFAEFITSYKKHLSQTYLITLILTLFCCAGAMVLLRLGEFNEYPMSRNGSILDYFFYRFSNSSSYYPVDITKILFVFLVAVFSVAHIRQSSGDFETSEFGFFQFFDKFYFKDILFLLVVLLVASGLDPLFSKLETYARATIANRAIGYYLDNLLFHLRIYVPLFLFAISIKYLTISEKINITLKSILYLYISLWIFNEFAYEFSGWVRGFIFNFILIPIQDLNKFYLFESILSIPFVAFLFLGYHSAMNFAFTQTIENKYKSID